MTLLLFISKYDILILYYWVSSIKFEEYNAPLIFNTFGLLYKFIKNIILIKILRLIIIFFLLKAGKILKCYNYIKNFN